MIEETIRNRERSVTFEDRTRDLTIERFRIKKRKGQVGEIKAL